MVKAAQEARPIVASTMDGEGGGRTCLKAQPEFRDPKKGRVNFNVKLLPFVLRAMPQWVPTMLVLPETYF